VPAVPLDVLHQGAVLLLRPRAFLHAGVVAAARGPPHLLLPAVRSLLFLQSCKLGCPAGRDAGAGNMRSCAG
jgi:hypothetical protein